MVVLVNYASEGYCNAQKLQNKTALKHGFDKVYSYNKSNLSTGFLTEYKDIIYERRGAGYWVWKSYIIRETLDKMDMGDYLMYLDSAAVFVEDVHILLDIMDRHGLNIMTFGPCSIEKKYTKRDAFILMDCDGVEYTDTPQIWAGCLILKKCSEVYELMDEWAKYAKNRQIITDDPSVSKNYTEFVENRHDQSILSLLCKKRSIIPFRDPSQHGDAGGTMYEKYVELGWMWPDEFPSIIYLHRSGAVASMWEAKHGAFLHHRIIKVIKEKRIREVCKRFFMTNNSK